MPTKEIITKESKVTVTHTMMQVLETILEDAVQVPAMTTSPSRSLRAFSMGFARLKC